MSKMSVRSQEFLDIVADFLHRGKLLVIWHQLPWSGGVQEWFLIDREEALPEILEGGQPGSAFTVYEWLEVPWPSVADQMWLSRATLSLQDKDHDLLVRTPVMSDTGVAKLTWVGDIEGLKEWFAQHQGASVAVMRLPWGTRLSDGTTIEEIVRGYFPDKDGTPRSGGY